MGVRVGAAVRVGVGVRGVGEAVGVRVAGGGVSVMVGVNVGVKEGWMTSFCPS